MGEVYFKETDKNYLLIGTSYHCHYEGVTRILTRIEHEILMNLVPDETIIVSMGRDYLYKKAERFINPYEKDDGTVNIVFHTVPVE
jgi:hypothetical protein